MLSGFHLPLEHTPERRDSPKYLAVLFAFTKQLPKSNRISIAFCKITVDQLRNLEGKGTSSSSCFGGHTGTQKSIQRSQQSPRISDSNMDGKVGSHPASRRYLRQSRIGPRSSPAVSSLMPASKAEPLESTGVSYS